MKQNILKQFEEKIALYDSMLVETGGLFGKGKFGGNKYAENCLDIVKEYISNTGHKEDVLSIIDKFISDFITQKDWKYIDLEMAFLYELKEKIANFCIK